MYYPLPLATLVGFRYAQHNDGKVGGCATLAFWGCSHTLTYFLMELSARMFVWSGVKSTVLEVAVFPSVGGLLGFFL